MSLAMAASENPSADVPLLSICIATRNRAHLLPETLSSLAPQLHSDIELVIVDGGSTDETEAVISEFAAQGNLVQYHFHSDSAGLDCDYDRSVGYARGLFCWLLTDDDIIDSNALSRIRAAIGHSSVNLLVLNNRVYSHDLENCLQLSRMPSNFCKEDVSCTGDELLKTVGDTLSFIGSVVIRRDLWLERERKSYYGSMFVHMAVILQLPSIHGVKLLTEPVMSLRYGVASWSDRAFEIWTILWPELIWTFDGYSDEAKRSVTARFPYQSALYLLKHRSRGSYGLKQYSLHLHRRTHGLTRLKALFVAILPGRVVNTFAVIYVGVLGGGGGLGLYDLERSPYANWASRWILKRLNR